ncbi:MAG: TetR/AcrR family transcriptional regulator [Acidobacteria bacterium]|nr:TetR/AcrR family transcriptional regulator [Acidobacteriota bacterium]
MKNAVRKQKEKDNLRQIIMDAARELFVTKGYEAVSMRKIAERIEYSPTTIYLYFEDKVDLMTQICEQTFAKLTRNIKAINRKIADPIEALRAGMHEYVNFGLRHPSHYLLLFNTRVPEEPRIAFAESNGKIAFETLREAVKACADAHKLSSKDVDLVSQTLWTGIHGVTSLLITQNHFPFVNRKKLIANAIDTMIDGAMK